jgi:Uma2 family endonuclease
MNGREWNVRVRSELRVQVAELNYRVPDVTVLDRSLPIEQVITHPPVAVFEILSPTDPVAKLFDKLKDYERKDIRNILVIDPNGEEERFYR